MSECPHCRDWGKYEKHEDHWPPSKNRRAHWWSTDEEECQDPADTRSDEEDAEDVAGISRR